MSRGDFPSAKQDQFVLRLPDGMRDRIKAAAEANNRSMNAEVIARLARSFQLDENQADVTLTRDQMRRLIALAEAYEDLRGKGED